MNTRTPRPFVQRALRTMQASLLAVALLPGTLGPAAPAVAERPEPDVRIIVEIKSIEIHDDMDWGDGDIRIDTRVLANNKLVVGDRIPEFHASDGDVVLLNHWLPRTGNDFGDPQASFELGIPIRLSESNTITIKGTEVDVSTDDDMGIVFAPIVDTNGQVRFGAHVERARGACEDRPILSDFCELGVPGAFTVQYVIREAQLPDLRPVGIKVHDLPGSPQKLVCAAIQNAGSRNAGPFGLTMEVDGAIPTGGFTQAGGLASGQAGDLCVQLTLPPGQHRLAAIVDAALSVPEVRENNNRYEQSVVARIISDSDDPSAHPTEGTTQTGQSVPVIQPTPSAPTGPTTRPTAAPSPTPSKGR